MTGAIGAVLLAAGQATRFRNGSRETKLAADLNGKPLIRYAAEAALASSAGRLIVVTGHAAEQVIAALAGLDFLTVHNSAFAEGLSGSLKTGIGALPPQTKGAVILLADMPFVTSDVIDRLILRFQAEPVEPDAAVPVRNGRRGNPVLIGRKLFSEIPQLRGDKGAAALLKQTGRTVIECAIDDAAIEIDVDTREMLDRLVTQPGS